MKNLIRKNDWIILAIAALFWGIAIVLYATSLSSNPVVENDQSIVLELEKIVRTNSELKSQISELNQKNQNYRSALTDQSKLESQIKSEMESLTILNATREVSGEGVVVEISGKVYEAQLVDLINAVKNIGCDAIAINRERINLYTPIDSNRYFQPYTIEIIGNSSLLNSALTRKGGIIEQLQSRTINVKITMLQSLAIPASSEKQFQYLKQIND